MRKLTSFSAAKIGAISTRQLAGILAADSLVKACARRIAHRIAQAKSEPSGLGLRVIIAKETNANEKEVDP